uniref:Uncharacterized protein n=1 Tax=Aegilops tauschii subsp. strangulata TaxID=200361 RepID=A0A453BXH8_AEGTS
SLFCRFHPISMSRILMKTSWILMNVLISIPKTSRFIVTTSTMKATTTMITMTADIEIGILAMYVGGSSKSFPQQLLFQFNIVGWEIHSWLIDILGSDARAGKHCGRM